MGGGRLVEGPCQSTVRPLPPASDYTAGLYGLYGQRAAMRQAGALGQAMRALA